jgi:hypothetical protein
MKKQTGIWIDSSKAVVVTLTNKQESVIEIGSIIENRIYHNREGDKGAFMGSRHINNEKTFDERRKQQIINFLDNIIEEIKDADEIFIFGPAEMKTKLIKRIEDDKVLLLQKLKSVVTADKMTTNQIVAKTKEYYNL